MTTSVLGSVNKMTKNNTDRQPAFKTMKLGQKDPVKWGLWLAWHLLYLSENENHTGSSRAKGQRDKLFKISYESPNLAMMEATFVYFGIFILA